jgi:hypothetical protein
MTHVDKAEEIMINEPERFLTILPLVNAKYADLLKARTTSGTAEPAKADPADEMPGPDVDLGNGKGTYSVDGIKKLMAWQAAQTRKSLETEFGTKFKPVTDRLASEERVNQIAAGLQQKVDHARANWKGFKDWEADILTEINQKGAATLDEAYGRVKDRKHEEALAAATANEAALREKIIKDLKAQPTSTSSAGAATTSTTKKDEPKTIEDIIRERTRAAEGKS